ncbi:hypothetical protein, partial [Rubritalea marina]|uniref:hypothetical protein n=1 Tax=Rubritalea marina TaxID=361055 RepID=UPI000524F30E
STPLATPALAKTKEIQQSQENHLPHLLMEDAAPNPFTVESRANSQIQTLTQNQSALRVQ